MDYKSVVAQTRLHPKLVEEVRDKLTGTGLTMADYLRGLVLNDLGRNPINVPDNLATLELTAEELKSLDKSMEDIKAGRVTKVKYEDLESYLESL